MGATNCAVLPVEYHYKDIGGSSSYERFTKFMCYRLSLVFYFYQPKRLVHEFGKAPVVYGIII
jgi:hypothetical protein